MAQTLPRELLDASVSESTPWLMELMRVQAARRRPRDLLAQFERDAFVAPALLDQRSMLRLDGLALEAASDYEALLLSPLAPLGVCSALAPSSQDRTISALRGTEVVSDPTNVLVLECARRLRAEPDRPVRLCTVHQTVRTQPPPPGAGYSRHFRLFAMVEAGRGLPEDGFEVGALAKQVGVFDRLLDSAVSALGCRFGARRLLVRSDAARDTLAGRLCERLARDYPHASLARERFESRYYAGIRVSFGPHTASGDWIPIGDLGLFDWLGRVSSNQRLRFVAAGLGLQLLSLLFR